MSSSAPNRLWQESVQALLVPDNSLDPAQTVDQLVRVLGIYMRHVKQDSPLFAQFVNTFEKRNFMPLLFHLPEKDLEVFMDVVRRRFRMICLSAWAIEYLLHFCQRLNISALMKVRNCFVLPGSGPGLMSMSVLSELMPQLDLLNMSVRLIYMGNVTFNKLRVLHLRHGVSQVALDGIFDGCPELRELGIGCELDVSNITEQHLNISNIYKCGRLRELILPLHVEPFNSLANLQHLHFVSLHYEQLWPGLDWMQSMSVLIEAKRFELRTFYLDGSWIYLPFDLSTLGLAQCVALTELALSKCKLLPSPYGIPVLPNSVQKLSFSGCRFSHVSTLYRYLGNCVLLQALYFMNCNLQGGGRVLCQIMRLRSHQPVVSSLSLRFFNCIELRSELLKWSPDYREQNTDFLNVQELGHDQDCVHLPTGTLTMELGKLVNHNPTLTLPGSGNLPNGQQLLSG